jgi:hypothetical protein
MNAPLNQLPLDLFTETYSQSKHVNKKRRINSEYASVISSSKNSSVTVLLSSSTNRPSNRISATKSVAGRHILKKPNPKNKSKRRRKEPRFVIPKQAPWSTHPWVMTTATVDSVPNRTLIRKYSDEDEETDEENSNIFDRMQPATSSWSTCLKSSEILNAIKSECITPEYQTKNNLSNGKSSTSMVAPPISNEPIIKQEDLESRPPVAVKEDHEILVNESFHTTEETSHHPNHQTVAIKIIDDVPPPDESSLDYTWTNLSESELRRLNEKALELAMCGPKRLNRSYTMQEFLDLVEVAKNHFYDLETLEGSAAVTRANRVVRKEDSSYQSRAQYGRTLWAAGEVSTSTILWTQRYAQS